MKRREERKKERKKERKNEEIQRNKISTKTKVQRKKSSTT